MSDKTMDQLIKCIKLEQEKENDLNNDDVSVSFVCSYCPRLLNKTNFVNNHFLIKTVQNRGRPRRRANGISVTNITGFFGSKCTRRQFGVRLCTTFLNAGPMEHHPHHQQTVPNNSHKNICYSEQKYVVVSQ
jgi:hypothetical protein